MSAPVHVARGSGVSQTNRFTGPLEIDWSHPMAIGLAHFSLFTPANAFVDLVRGETLARSGRLLPFQAPDGPVAMFGDGSGSGAATTNGGDAYYAPPSNRFTLGVRVASLLPSGNNAQNRLVQLQSSGGDTSGSCVIRINTTSTYQAFVGSAGTTTGILAGVGGATSLGHTIVVTYDGTTLGWVIDGNIGLTGASTTRTLSAIDRLSISDGGAEYARSAILWVAYWKGRAMSKTEAAILNTESAWPFLRKPIRRIYSFASVSAGGPMVSLIT